MKIRIPKWVMWVWTIKARKRLANRSKVRAAAIIELARMGSPSKRARYLGLENGYFVFGMPPSVKSLTTVERTRLLLDGDNAQINYRKVLVKPETVYENAKAHSDKTGEPMPTYNQVTLGI